MQGFSVVRGDFVTLFDPQKSRGKSSAHAIHLVVNSLLYYQKKDILYMGFHIDIGKGVYQGLGLIQTEFQVINKLLCSFNA